MTTSTEEIIEDGESNYSNGRLKDAFSHFQLVVQNQLRAGKVEEALYYMYRSLLCLKQKPQDFSRELVKFSVNLLKLSFQQLYLSIETNADPWKKNPLLQLLLDITNQTDFNQQKDTITQQLFDNNKTILEEPTLQLEKRIQILQDQVRLSNTQDWKTEGSKHINLLAQAYYQKYQSLSFDEMAIYAKSEILERLLELEQTVISDKELQDELQLIERYMSSMR